MSSKLSVGVHILTVLAMRRGQGLTSGWIAGSVNTNPVVIRRLLGLLREAGYVESKTGVGGGWVLVADPARITLLDVLRAVEPQDEMFALHRSGPNRECPVGRNICTVLKEIYVEVYESVAERLASTTIAGVVAKLGEESRSEGHAQNEQPEAIASGAPETSSPTSGKSPRPASRRPSSASIPEE